MMIERFVKSSIILLFLAHTVQIAVAQTYATPELQQQEEHHIKEKAAKKGLSEKVNTEVEQPVIQAQKLPDLTRYVEVSGIEAVKIASHYSKEEKAGFEEEATSEFKLNNFYLSFEEGKFIRMNRQTKAFSIWGIVRTDSGFSLDCRTCNIPAFTIVEQSATKVVCDQPASDEGQEFEFRFTFEK